MTTWTKEEEANFSDDWLSGQPIKDMAAKYERSNGSLAYKARQMGLPGLREVNARKAAAMDSEGAHFKSVSGLVGTSIREWRKSAKPGDRKVISRDPRDPLGGHAEAVALSLRNVSLVLEPKRTIAVRL